MSSVVASASAVADRFREAVRAMGAGVSRSCFEALSSLLRAIRGLLLEERRVEMVLFGFGVLRRTSSLCAEGEKDSLVWRIGGRTAWAMVLLSVGRVSLYHFSRLHS